MNHCFDKEMVCSGKCIEQGRVEQGRIDLSKFVWHLQRAPRPAHPVDPMQTFSYHIAVFKRSSCSNICEYVSGNIINF